MESFHQMICERIYPHIEKLCGMVYHERDHMMLDGAYAFTNKEFFLPGTTLSTFYYLLCYLKEENRQDLDLWKKRMSELVLDNMHRPINTFGILEFLRALYGLKQEGMLDEIVSKDTFDELKGILDWRIFVDEENFTLKGGRPTNYMGVAYRVALLREQLGWECSEKYSEKFLKILSDHIVIHSRGRMYMDETEGQGRYDKYSAAIASELCGAALLVDEKPTDVMVSLMKNAVGILDAIADTKGGGFPYSRSIGSHAISLVIETRPLALQMGLEKDEMAAYTDCCISAYQICNFWFNKKRGCFNIWDDGRRTDDYRNKGRVLEVNLDLSLKLIRADRALQKCGLNKKLPYDTDTYKKILHERSANQLIRFESDEFERAAFIARRGDQVFVLPIINGGKHYYDQVLYLPIPFCGGIIEGTPDEVRPNLVPMVTLQDGQKVMPLSYFKNINVNETEKGCEVSFSQDELCLITESIYPAPFKGGTAKTHFVFGEDTIECETVVTLKGRNVAKNISMSLDTFSTQPQQTKNTVTFKQGLLKSFETQGVSVKNIVDVFGNPQYSAPEGYQNYSVVCSEESSSQVIRVLWKIKFNPTATSLL